MRLPFGGLARFLYEQWSVKVFTESAMSSILRISFKFFARVDKRVESTDIFLRLTKGATTLSVNRMDEKKKGVASEQSTWEARRQAARAARVLSLSTVSDAT